MVRPRTPLLNPTGTAQDSMTPYKVEQVVSGDISIAIFFGSQFIGQRLSSRPPLAFAFHTAFVDAETVRITPAQLDAADPAIFAPTSAQSFFMDIVLKDEVRQSAAALAAVRQRCTLVLVMLLCAPSSCCSAHACHVSASSVAVPQHLTRHAPSD